MILYSNGCSHSRGACTLDIRDSHPLITMSSLVGKDNYKILQYDQINPNPYTFSNHHEIISKIKKNNHYLVYQPHFGKSNERIFFESINFLYECIQNKLNIDYSVIQWSGVNRTISSRPSDQPPNYCDLVDVNPHDNSELGLKFEPWASASTLQYMKILQSLYEKYNVEYVFIPYMEVGSDVFDKYPISKNLDLSRFTIHPTVGHRNEFRKKCLVCDAHGHPSQLGSYILSSMTLDLFGLNNSLIGIYDYYGDRFYSDVYKKHHGISWIKENYNKLGDATEAIINKFR